MPGLFPTAVQEVVCCWLIRGLTVSLSPSHQSSRLSSVMRLVRAVECLSYAGFHDSHVNLAALHSGVVSCQICPVRRLPPGAWAFAGTYRAITLPHSCLRGSRQRRLPACAASPLVLQEGDMAPCSLAGCLSTAPGPLASTRPGSAAGLDPALVPHPSGHSHTPLLTPRLPDGATTSPEVAAFA